MKRYAKHVFFICILGLAAALLPLSGCGGGGSDNTGSSNNPPPISPSPDPAPDPTPPSPDPAPDPTPPSPGNALEAAQSEGGQGAIAKASQNSPKAGSVTQSSNAGSDGVTTDSVSVEARRVGDKVQYRVRNSNAGWSVDSREDTVLDRVGGEDWDGVELKKRLSGADLYVDVYAGPVPPSDHLAGGLWVLYVPDSATNVDDFVFGAFVDGNDPFEQSELSALTGVVTYEGEGDVTLVYSDANLADRRNYFPEASVTLMVDFDNETVSGTIHSFDADGEPVNLNMAELTLEEANIGDSDSGFFSGDTRGTTPKGVNGEGKWGGQFFGNGDGAPKGVAGTFGFTTSNGEESVLGVFGASRSSEGLSPSGFAPANQAAFDVLVVGKRLLSSDPSYYTDFPSPGRFEEVEPGETYTGRYTYENTGPNSATVEFHYDDGDRCTSRVTFNSATTGTLTFSCNDGEGPGGSSWRIENTPSAPSEGIPAPDTPDLVGDAVTGEITECSGIRSIPSSASVLATIRGTVQARRSVSSVYVTGTVNGQFVRRVPLGSISAGRSANFTIIGTISTFSSGLSCDVRVEWSTVL